MADINEAPGSADTQQSRQAAVLDRHLPEGYSADPEVSLANEPVVMESPRAGTPAFDEAMPSPAASQPGSLRAATPLSPNSGSEAVESSLLLQGGDIHRDMFRIQARARGSSLRRAATFSHKPSPRLHPEADLSYPETREPGGFRRSHLQRQAQLRRIGSRVNVTKSFVDFLDLYGSFAGENLEDEDSALDEESAIEDDEGDDEEQGERRPLLRPAASRPTLAARRSSKRMSRGGDASTLKTFFTLIKAFIGTGIMFLPKAFSNGGILFSSMTLLVVSLVTSLCFQLLLDCRKIYGGGYGELGAEIAGPRFRSVILFSIGLSQLGFVCAGLIFTAENLYSFLQAVTPNHYDLKIGVSSLIAIQLIPLIPLGLIRNISKLGPVALFADVFILIGLIYIWTFDIQALARNGIEPSVKLFNPSYFTLTIGSAIFTFEGIGLILPIQASMKKPHHFAPLLYFVMFLITVIFTAVGALCYATFGEHTNVQIISNFPQDSALVNAVQFLYSIAVLAGDPVQQFPATRILETSIFGEQATGKKSVAMKWKKNGLRTLILAVCVGISIVGASDVDKFVSLIGSFACVPLVYIYPPYLHLRGAAQRTWVKVLDVTLIVVGLIAMVYTTIVGVYQWIAD